MKVAFVMPKPPQKVNGGYRIVYQYANYLSRRGHEITIYYTTNRGANGKGIPGFLCYLIKKAVYKRNQWFPLDEHITQKVIYDIKEKYLEYQDAMFATMISTSRKVDALSNKTAKKKYYLIQGFETWGLTEEEVYETYNYDFTNIAISKYLYDLVKNHSRRETVYIPNGLDFEELWVDHPINKRNSYSLAFLYHPSQDKGTYNTINVICRVKKKYPQLEVRCFGTVPRPADLPEWVSYYERADRVTVRNILNEAAIFLCSTIEEGFGLTGAESMACGCALVSTAYQAVFDYAIDRRNALLSPIGDVDAMYGNVCYLLEHSEERIRIATNAASDIHCLEWENSINAIEKLLIKNNC